MASYFEHVKSAIGAVASPRTELARVANVIGDAGGSSVSKFMSDLRDSAPRDVEDGIGSLAGAVVGTYYGYRHKHWLLGAIGGTSLGRNLPALIHPGDRTIALKNLGTTGFALACAMMSHKRRWLGFGLGWAAARTAIYVGERVRGT